MALIQSDVTGNWSAGATWIGGVKPGAGDTWEVIDGDVVTFDESWGAVGALTGTVTNGELAFAAGARTMYLDGDLNIEQNGTLTVRHGHILMFDCDSAGEWGLKFNHTGSTCDIDASGGIRGTYTLVAVDADEDLLSVTGDITGDGLAAGDLLWMQDGYARDRCLRISGVVWNDPNTDISITRPQVANPDDQVEPSIDDTVAGAPAGYTATLTVGGLTAERHNGRWAWFDTGGAGRWVFIHSNVAGSIKCCEDLSDAPAVGNLDVVKIRDRIVAGDQIRVFLPAIIMSDSWVNKTYVKMYDTTPVFKYINAQSAAGANVNDKRGIDFRGSAILTGADMQYIWLTEDTLYSFSGWAATSHGEIPLLSRVCCRNFPGVGPGYGGQGVLSYEDFRITGHNTQNIESFLPGAYGKGLLKLLRCDISSIDAFRVGISDFWNNSFVDCTILIGDTNRDTLYQGAGWGYMKDCKAYGCSPGGDAPMFGDWSGHPSHVGGWELINCDFDVLDPTKPWFATSGRFLLRNTTYKGTTEPTGANRYGTGMQGWVRSENDQGVSGAWKEHRHSGVSEKEVGTVRTGANALKMTPNANCDDTLNRFCFDLEFPVADGANPTVSIYCRLNAAYSADVAGDNTLRPVLVVDDQSGITGGTSAQVPNAAGWTQLTVALGGAALGNIILRARLEIPFFDTGNEAYFDDADCA